MFAFVLRSRLVFFAWLRIKRKFGTDVVSKNPTAMVNEVLCKLIRGASTPETSEGSWCRLRGSHSPRSRRLTRSNPSRAS